MKRKAPFENLWLWQEAHELVSRYQKLIIGLNSYVKYIGNKRDKNVPK